MDMDTDELIEQIEDELGIDVYYVYGGGRHFAVPAVVLAFLGGLLSAYLLAFLGVEDAAKSHRKALLAFLKRLREGEAGSAEAEARARQEKEQAARLADQAAPPGGSASIGTDERRARARRAMEEILLASEVPPAAASAHAAAIAALIEAYLDQQWDRPG
jgi:broad specificity phosphatase PhoE